jgi:hypothetical protein
MKPGRVKGVRVDWFTLLFEFPRAELGARNIVVSFNGATRLILGHEFFNSGYTQALRQFNLYPNLPLPTRA